MDIIALLAMINPKKILDAIYPLKNASPVAAMESYKAN